MFLSHTPSLIWVNAVDLASTLKVCCESLAFVNWGGPRT